MTDDRLREAAQAVVDDLRRQPAAASTVVPIENIDALAASLAALAPDPRRAAPAPGGVHNHGPEEGPGIACREHLIGACRLAPVPRPNALDYNKGVRYLAAAIANARREAPHD
jgi:hypothetical protein